MLKKIKDCLPMEEVELVLRLSDIQIKKTTSDADYASLIAFDGERKMEAKIWKFTDDLRAKLESGEVYLVNGRMKEYQGKLQINITNLRKITPVDNVDLSEFYEKAKLTNDDLAKLINDYYVKIDNPILKDTVKTVLRRHYNEFFEYPAAVTMHHNYYYGLAYHTYSMLKLSDNYLSLYPFVNKSLVYAGIILHDIGKVMELSGPKGTEYTKAGRLIGHIALGANEIYAISKELGYANSEEILNLIHIILSHHGELEYGSPKVPMTPEAELVHLLDYSDSRMASLDAEINKTEKGEFTGQIAAFDKKSFYVPDLN